MRRLLVSLLVLAACAGADEPRTAADVEPTSGTEPSAAEPSAPPATTVDAIPTGSTEVLDETIDGVLPNGFDLVGARLTAADGQVCDLCLWLAETSEQRRRGLMFVTDLGPADGMAFLYQSPRTTRFNMEQTVLPLSIAFYRPDGAFMDSFDMQPCLGDDCDKYPTPVDFMIAVETLQGDLPKLGMIAGSTLELLGLPCSPDSG